MEIGDKEIQKWQEMYENDDSEFQKFQEEILNSFRLEKIDSDNYVILCRGTKVIELKHCYYVSKGFIQQVFESQREFFFEESFEGVKEIDVNELLDQAIQEDWWDWRRQVAVYKGEIQKKI